MSIDFDQTRWQRVLGNWDRWFDGELGRPIVAVTLTGARDAGRPKPASAGKERFVPMQIEMPIEDMLDADDYWLSRNRYLGDAFPSIHPNYGAGALAAFLGARVNADKENQTVWFHPPAGQPADTPADQLMLRFDEENVWFRHIQSLVTAAVERWGRLVQIGMTDLGGNLDVVATFRPARGLLLDLYDCPEQVERLINEVLDAWLAAWDALNEIIQPMNPGYSAWAGLISSRPHYMLQSDFAYMISPEMFDRFVRPELATMCKRIPYSFYHLDGVGQLPHLDSLLTIEELKGVQWIPGTDQPDMRHWPDVYGKIHAAGKNIQLFPCWNADGTPDFETLDKVADQIGSAEPIFIGFQVDAKYEDQAVRMLERFGVEP